MAKDNETIKREIKDFVARHKGEYPDYYIGITKHIEQWLVENNETINEHLNKGEYTKGMPIYTAECYSRDEAVEIEQYFQNEGDGMLKYNPSSHGDAESVFVYCYKMDQQNKQVILETENSSEGINMNRHTKRFKDFEQHEDTGF